MAYFDAQDAAGVTDAAVGAIALMPLLIAESAVGGAMIVLAIIMLFSIYIGPLPTDLPQDSLYPHKLALASLIAIIIFIVIIIVAIVISQINNNLAITYLGAPLPALITLLWEARIIAKQRIFKKLQQAKYTVNL